MLINFAYDAEIGFMHFSQWCPFNLKKEELAE
jgi:hypothetical protein